MNGSSSLPETEKKNNETNEPENNFQRTIILQNEEKIRPLKLSDKEEITKDNYQEVGIEITSRGQGKVALVTAEQLVKEPHKFFRSPKLRNIFQAYFNNNLSDDDAFKAMKDELECSVTSDLKNLICVTPSGWFYEKKAIDQWRQQNGSDPNTRQIITDVVCLSNISFLTAMLPDVSFAPSYEKFKQDIAAGNWERVQAFIANNTDPEDYKERKDAYYYAIVIAAREEKYDVVKQLIEKKTPLDYLHRIGLIDFAIRGGNVEIVRLLIDNVEYSHDVKYSDLVNLSKIAREFKQKEVEQLFLERKLKLEKYNFLILPDEILMNILFNSDLPANFFAMANTTPKLKEQLKRCVYKNSQFLSEILKKCNESEVKQFFDLFPLLPENKVKHLLEEMELSPVSALFFSSDLNFIEKDLIKKYIASSSDEQIVLLIKSKPNLIETFFKLVESDEILRIRMRDLLYKTPTLTMEIVSALSVGDENGQQSNRKRFAKLFPDPEIQKFKNNEINPISFSLLFPQHFSALTDKQKVKVQKFFLNDVKLHFLEKQQFTDSPIASTRILSEPENFFMYRRQILTKGYASKYFAYNNLFKFGDVYKDCQFTGTIFDCGYKTGYKHSGVFTGSNFIGSKFQSNDWITSIYKTKSNDNFLNDNKGVKFYRNNLSLTTLSNIDLTYSHFVEVDFRGATLEKVNLRNADLSGADFRGTTFKEVILKDANLENTIFLTSEFFHTHDDLTDLQNELEILLKNCEQCNYDSTVDRKFYYRNDNALINLDEAAKDNTRILREAIINNINSIINDKTKTFTLKQLIKIRDKLIHHPIFANERTEKWRNIQKNYSSFYSFCSFKTDSVKRIENIIQEKVLEITFKKPVAASIRAR